MTGPERTNDSEQSSRLDDAIRSVHDWSRLSPSTAVVRTVAIAADRRPKSLEPLYEAVDPDALDAFVGSSEDDSRDGAAIVSFAFAGHDVVVKGDGTVAVGPVDPRTNAQ